MTDTATPDTAPAAKRLYTTRAFSEGGRNGTVRTEEGNLSLHVATPGGPNKEATNPEQLFAAGYAACFAGAVAEVARREKVKLEHPSISTVVGLDKVGNDFRLAVELHVFIPGVDEATGRRIMEAAHHVCPYSAAVQGNVDVKLVYGEG